MNTHTVASDTMAALVATRYGQAPRSLERREIPRPVVGPDDVLVRTRASIVSAADVAFLHGDPAIVRLMYGLMRPRFPVLGVEFAGRVEQVGARVTSLAVGDDVFAASAKRFGARAQFTVVPADDSIAKMPAGCSYEEAAVLLEAATALTFFTRVAPLEPGERVLVIGASGAVGSSAVQLAKHFGAHVTAVCSAANAELVTSLGADSVIDYAVTDFARMGEKWDVILDAVGSSAFTAARAALAPRGVYLATVPTPAILLHTLVTKRSKGQRAIFAATGLMHAPEILGRIAELVEAGALRPIIDRTYLMAETAEAYEYVATGRKRGGVAISMD